MLHVAVCLPKMHSRALSPPLTARCAPPPRLPLLLLPQVFLDVVESVNLLVNSNGTVVRSEVVGALKMRAYLSGMVS